MFKLFNINDYVKVRLTDKGMKVLADHYGGEIPEWFVNYMEDGWTKFQLWDLASIFGENLYNGCTLPFETNILIEVKE
jgi:hypothetical protein